jgi:HD-GYP domain-containing protein (c-di-GMP phosphodiesterase class II)
MKIFQANIQYQISYDLLDSNSLRMGYAVPFNIFIKKNNDYVIILEAGTVLTQKLHKMLLSQENIYVLKKEADKQILSCSTLQNYLEYNKSDLLKTLELLTEVNALLFDTFLENEDDKIDLECVTKIVKSIKFLIKQNPRYLKNTITHFQNDHKLAHHSLYVTIYAISLGFFLKFSDEQLLQLGTAALLHDVGFKKIDDSVRNKTSKLSKEESELMQKHPGLSVKIAQKNKVSDPYILNAIMHHHECNDASGYPEHLLGESIGNGAAILAICDVFNALTNDRPYRTKYSSFEALQLMMKDELMALKFNQKYIKTFLTSLL